MRNFNESTITDAVIERIKDAPIARVKEISASLIRHLHDFLRDVRLTEAEWVYAIDFLTRTGKTCDGNRQAGRACTPTPTASTAFGRSSRQPIRSPMTARSA